MLKHTIHHPTFTSEGYQLQGTLYAPGGDGPYATIVVLHGAGAGNQDDPLYMHLARAMNEIGVAVFVYDRRRARIHPGYMALARDALSAVHMLKKRDDVDDATIGLWGVSQGGWVAPAAFVQCAGDIAFLVLVSSSGVGPAQQMVHAVSNVLRSAGYDAAVVTKAVQLRELVHRYYRGEVARDVAQAQIDQHKNEPWFAHLYVGETLPHDVTRTGWYHETQFEPRPVFRQITAPLLLLYGEDDPWIPVEESIAIWRDALREAGNDKVEIHRVPRTGHSMLVDEPPILNDGDAQNLEFSRTYTRLMQDFVRRITATP